jgi:pyruvate formate lyase activating enzyme
MQGIVFDIKRFAVHDGPGIRTTVFMKGCPLNCFWCHNPESIDSQPFHSVKKIKLDGVVYDQPEEVGLPLSVNYIMDKILKDRIFMEESGGGVTFSGGEPTMQPDFLLQMLRTCKEESLHTAVDTCGYASMHTFTTIIPYTDLFLFDLKHFNNDEHLAATGKSNGVILKNLEFLLQTGKKVQVRIPIIPGFNFNEADLTTMVALLKSMSGKIEQVDLLPYHTIAQNKYKRFGINNRMAGIKGLNKEDLTTAKKIFEGEGFKVKIGG